MIRVRVGAVEVRTDAELSLKEIKSLLRDVAGIAVVLGLPEPAQEPSPLGFTAHLERLPDELPESPA